MDEIVGKTREDLEAMNKILEEDNRKLEKKNLATLEEARRAQEDGDRKQAALLFAEAQKQQQAIKQQNDIMDVLKKKLSEKEKADKEAAKTLSEFQNKT
jgi:hypothetical protein